MIIIRAFVSGYGSYKIIRNVIKQILKENQGKDL